MYQPLFDPNTQTLGSGFTGFGVPNGWIENIHTGASGPTTQGPISMGATPEVKDSSILAQYRMMNQMYGKSPQVDLSGITDWGSGIGKGVQNVMNMRMYNQQQAQQEAQMQQLGQDLQAQAEAKAQAEQQKMEAQYTALVGSGLTPQQAMATIYGAREAVQPFVNQAAELQGKQDEYQWKAGSADQMANGLWRVDPKTGAPTMPDPQMMSRYQLLTGQAPQTYYDVTDQLLKLQQGGLQNQGTTLDNTLKANMMPLTLAQAGEDLKGTGLTNEGKAIENQYKPQVLQQGLQNSAADYNTKTFDLQKKQNDAATETANKSQLEADLQALRDNPSDMGALYSFSLKHPETASKVMGTLKSLTGQGFDKNPAKALEGLAGKVAPKVEKAPATLQLPQMPTAQQAGQATRGVVGAGWNQLYNLPGQAWNALANPVNYGSQFGQSLYGGPSWMYTPQIPTAPYTPLGQ